MDVRRGKVAAAAYRRVGKRWLITNDAGHFAQLDAGEFAAYLGGRLESGGALWNDLQRKGFIRDHLDFDALVDTYREKNSFLFQAARLHIIVTTLRCNHNCVYCHSSSVAPDRFDKDMSVETARKTVDFIFQCPNPTLILEFQGGESLLNWPVLKFITRYAKLKNEAARRNLFVTLVSNFSMMDEEKFRFLVSEMVGVCTSLDGPADVHNANRVFTGGDSHDRVVRWLRRFQEAADGGLDGKRHFKPGALMSTTRLSLGHAERIVDEYVRLGLPGIFVRQLNPIGYARRKWEKVGYTADEFLAFYREMLDHILEVNRGGTVFYERAALTMLTKILLLQDPGYVDMRSPSGSGFGVLTYNHDGGVYTGDEARMVAREGDSLFRVGHVAESRYNDIFDHPVLKAAAVATLLENQPLCSQCVYKPYCGIDPVYNREIQRNIWGHMPDNDRCRLYMGMFDVIFEKLQDSSNRRVFESWLKAVGPAAPAEPEATEVR
ncbi:MAG: His-Xaa-Ser system radical SAM maturase HxsB [Elusimicrobiota bacterium]